MRRGLLVLVPFVGCLFPSVGELTAAFDVNIASITSNVLSFSVISVSDANKVGCNLILTAKTGITSVQIQQHDGSGTDLGDTTVPLDNPLVAGTWSRLEFHIKGSTTVTGLTVLVDGVPSSSDPRFSSGPLTGCLMSNDVFLGLGLFYSIGTGLEEHLDNVIVDVK